ncbi:MAG: phosphohydrolase [Micavibrio sp.]
MNTAPDKKQKDGAWAESVSGRIMNVLDPSPDLISITDIAEGLAKQCRYNGQIPVFYSVAQHCTVVADLLPRRLAIYGLLHDAHEAYLGDLITPVKMAVSARVGWNVWKKIEEPLDKAIFEAFGLSWPLSETDQDILAHADRVALATEVRDLKPQSYRNNRKYWQSLPDPADFMIRPAPWPKAASLYIKKFIRLAEEFCPGHILTRQGLDATDIEGSHL